MTDRPQPQPMIAHIAPYVPGRSAAAPGVAAVKLSSNESPLGASPAAAAALEGFGGKLAVYPDGASTALRTVLGEAHGLAPDRIVCGNGSDDLLHLLAQCYLGPGDEAVMSRHGFSVYPIVTRAAGAEIVMAPERDFTADVDALLGAVTDRTRLVWLANPNNPTGTCLGAGELARLHRGLPAGVLLVIDSAYAEYVTMPDYDAGAALAEGAENVVMVRTFSKIGLAAARIGWMYAPGHVAEAVNRIRGPFNLNLAAQLAGAAAARDAGFTARLAAHNAEWRDWLTARLASNRIRVLPSEGNFVLALFADAATAGAAFDHLLARGLIVREVGGYGIPQGLRISIGTGEAMRAVADALADFGER